MPRGVKLLRPIFEEEMLLKLNPLPGSTEILKFCEENNILTAVLTNKHGPHARAACEHLGVSDFLTFVLGANDTKWKKPETELTFHALNVLKLPAEQTLYCGDSPYELSNGYPCSSKMRFGTNRNPLQK